MGHPPGPTRPNVPSGSGLLPIVLDEVGHTLRRLRALAQPVIDARQIETQLGLIFARDGIEESDVLQAQPALALAAVGDDHVIEGLIRRTAPRQAYRYHGRNTLK